MVKNNKAGIEHGFTLAELLVTIAILLCVVAIAYPLLNMNQKVSTEQLKESSQRKDVTSVSAFMSNDVRYSSSISVTGGTQLMITYKSSNSISYSMNVDASGKKYLERIQDGSSQKFSEVQNVKFVLENENLVSVRLFFDDTGSKYNDFKVSKWNYAFNPLKEEISGFAQFIVNNKIFVYGNKLQFCGDEINGSNGAIYINGDLRNKINNKLAINSGSHISVKNIYVTGDVDIDNGGMSIGIEDTGSIYVGGSLNYSQGGQHINGNVYVEGDVSLMNSQRVNGNIYTKGNLSLGNTPKISGSIQYMGDIFIAPQNHDYDDINKCVEVNSIPEFTVPAYQTPTMKPDDWYAQNGYESTNFLKPNIKIFTEEDYMFNNKTDKYSTKPYENITIVSKKNIIIDRGGLHFTGILYAPYGSITFKGDEFTGIAISRDGFFVINGGTHVNFKDITEMISNPADYPF